ncbi:MAG: M48 family metallopeptidase [Magnetococcus sp. YQC-9]
MSATIHVLQLPGLTVRYALHRHPLRKRLAVRVMANGEIEAHASMRMSQVTVERFLRTQVAWLHQQLERQQVARQARSGLSDGMFIPLLDEQLIVRVAKEGVTRARLVGNELWLPTPLAEDGLERSLARWYQRRALVYLPGRLAHWAGVMGVTWQKVTIRSQTARWGSCSNRGSINLNWKLMRLPLRLVDYVLVHELCHRLEMNHSPAFWVRVESVLPDWAVRRQELKRHAII